jgi:hypothetical protein
LHLNSRPHKQQTVHDDQLVARQASIDHHAGIGRATRLHPLDRGLATLDSKHVNAFLIGNQSGLRNHHFLFRLLAFDFDSNELSIDERAGRVRERGAHKYRVGVTIDLDIDEVDGAFLLVCRAVGKTKTCFGRRRYLDTTQD